MKKMITRRNFLKVAGASAAALGLAACGGSSSSTASSAASSTAASSTAAKADGKVYYLNFKPEQDQAWQDLAKAYTEETGVPAPRSPQRPAACHTPQSGCPWGQ